MSLTELPWHAVRNAVETLRRRRYTITVTHDHLIYDAEAFGLEDLRKHLARHHFSTWDILSYRYCYAEYGPEELNMRRIEVLDEKGNWWQLHIRAIETDDGRLVVAPHYELCPVEHPVRHLDEEGFDDTVGFRLAREVIDTEDRQPVEVKRDYTGP